MTYRPQPVPSGLQRDAQAYLAQEFRKLQNTLDVVEFQTFVERGSEPSKLADGMVAFADGSNWNPGKGAGLYARVGGAWELASSDLDAAADETISGAWSFTGDATFNTATFNSPATLAMGLDAMLILKDTSQTGGNSFVAFQEWRGSTGTRQGYFGFAASINTDIYLTNEAGGDILLKTTSGSPLVVEGNNATLVRTRFENLATSPAQTDLHIDNGSESLYVGINYGGSANAFIDNRTTGDLFFKEVGTNLIQIAAGSTKFYHNVQIDTDGAGPMLTLSDGAGANNDVLLKFSTDRPWEFRQVSTGASTGLSFQNNNDAKVFYVRDSNSVAIQEWYHNATAGNSYIRIKRGAYTRWYDSNNTNWLQNSHTGTWGLVRGNVGLGFRPNNSSANAGNVYWHGTSGTVADDATYTYTLGRAAGIVIITDTSSRVDMAMFAHNGTSITTIHAGGNVSIGGAGTNPNVDGNVNIWKSGTNSIAIKNRRGGNRVFGMFEFTG